MERKSLGPRFHKAGVPKMRIHDLRRSAMTILMAQGRALHHGVIEPQFRCVHAPIVRMPDGRDETGDCNMDGRRFEPFGYQRGCQTAFKAWPRNAKRFVFWCARRDLNSRPTG